MSEPSSSILKKMIAPPRASQEDVPLTSSRAVKLALSRSANDAHGLSLSADTVTETLLELEEISTVLSDELLLIELSKDGALTGVIAVDNELQSAILEIQTIGKVLETPSEPRKATATDTMLVLPMLANFLQKLEQTTPRTELEGWSNTVQLQNRIATLRAASLALPDKAYRAVQISVKIDTGSRVGQLVLVLPTQKLSPQETQKSKQPAEVWAHNLQETVLESKAVLDAVLYKEMHALSQVQSWSVGQVIPLTGCTVGSVRMVDSKGKTAATAKLGQFAGRRAVRLQPHTPHMHDYNH